MTLTQLRYIITITDCGSMNRAAEQLYVAQPSLTGAVKELEKELGVRIFNRSGRGVTLTPDGERFLLYAREIYSRYEDLLDGFGGKGIRKKFGVSTQHYSFAVQAFINTVKAFGMDDYDLAIRETKTREVIEDVATLKSEIGVLYLSDFNRKALQKLFAQSELEFHPLTDCDAFVYMWKGHPLAGEKSIRFEQLTAYPCLNFEQGDGASFYYAEEILTTNEYPRTIRSNDRATQLNLMKGLNGYTLCSGIISEELNGDDYVAVPFEADEKNPNSIMEIGYLTRKGMQLSSMGERYVLELRRYLGLEE